MLARSALFLALTTLAACVEPDERSHDFTYLHATIIEPSCATANCHAAMTAQNAVDLSTPERACNSIDPTTLMDLLTGNLPENSIAMPPDGPLPPGDLELIAAWIDGGARCD